MLNILPQSGQLIDCFWATPVSAQCFLLPAATQTLQVSDSARKAGCHPGAWLPTWGCAPPFSLLLSSQAHHRPSVQLGEISAPGTAGTVYKSQLLTNTTGCIALQGWRGKGHFSLTLFLRPRTMPICLEVTKQGAFARTSVLGCQPTGQSGTARETKLYPSFRVQRTPNAGAERFLPRPWEGRCAVASLHSRY